MKLDLPKRFYSDRDWALKHHNELIGKYEDSWVAIFNRKVVASSDDVYEALDIAKKKTRISEIPVVYISKMSNVY